MKLRVCAHLLKKSLIENFFFSCSGDNFHALLILKLGMTSLEFKNSDDFKSLNPNALQI